MKKKSDAGLKNIRVDYSEKVKSTRSNHSTLDARKPVARPANTSPRIGIGPTIPPSNKSGTAGDGLPKFPTRAVSLRK